MEKIKRGREWSWAGPVVDSAEERHKGEAPATKEQIEAARLAKERARSHREVLTAYYSRGGSVWVPKGELMSQAMQSFEGRRFIGISEPEESEEPWALRGGLFE